MEYDTASEGEDDRKPPEGDMDSKCTAPDEGDEASKGTAPESEPDSKCTAPEDTIDSKSTAPDGCNADCYMIHIPTALENQIRATVVNRRHLIIVSTLRITITSSLMVDRISVYSNIFKHLVC